MKASAKWNADGKAAIQLDTGVSGRRVCLTLDEALDFCSQVQEQVRLAKQAQNAASPAGAATSPFREDLYAEERNQRRWERT